MIEAAPAVLICPCVKRHSPPAVVIEQHHVLPLSWGGPDTPANKVAICAQTHFTIHALLNQYVHTGDTPSRGELNQFPPYARILAAQAWQQRIPGHPTPYW